MLLQADLVREVPQPPITAPTRNPITESGELAFPVRLKAIRVSKHIDSNTLQIKNEEEGEYYFQRETRFCAVDKMRPASGDHFLFKIRSIRGIEDCPIKSGLNHVN